MSCTDKFEEINTNTNKLSELEPSQIPFLFSKAQSTATNNGWNYQIAQNLFHDQYCQYFANTTTYFPSDRLVIRMDWIRAAWNPIYTEVVPQLQINFSMKQTVLQRNMRLLISCGFIRFTASLTHGALFLILVLV